MWRIEPICETKHGVKRETERVQPTSSKKRKKGAIFIIEISKNTEWESSLQEEERRRRCRARLGVPGPACAAASCSAPSPQPSASLLPPSTGASTRPSPPRNHPALLASVTVPLPCPSTTSPPVSRILLFFFVPLFRLFDSRPYWFTPFL